MQKMLLCVNVQLNSQSACKIEINVNKLTVMYYNIFPTSSVLHGTTSSSGKSSILKMLNYSSEICSLSLVTQFSWSLLCFDKV